MSELDAVYGRAVAYATEVLQGARTPYEGARELWRLSTEVDRLADALRAFVALASEWEDDPENRIAYENDIRIEAERLRREFGP
jgi:hypothetical protein